MKKFLLAMVMICASSLSFAVDSSLDVSKLTQEQRAQIQLDVTKLANPTDTSEKLRDEASKWGELGKNVGTALVASAKEVGQGVNEFSQTNVGKVTIAIIVYKIIGRDVIKLAVGLLTLVIGTPLAIYCWLRMGKQVREYDNIPRLNGLWISHKPKTVYYDTEFKIAGIVMGCFILFFTWVVGLNIIF